MNAIRLPTALLGCALLVGCSDRNAPTAPAAHPLASAAGGSIASFVELSRPNAVGTCDDGFLSDIWSIDHAEEPVVAVNPAHPGNIVAAWIQGPFQNIVSAASFDGGQTWQKVPVPLTTCAGGQFLIAGDPRLSFGPNGALYGIAVVGNDLPSRGAGIFTSTDGGLHWTVAAVPGISAVDVPVDNGSITPDPTNPSFAYAIWDGTRSPHTGSAVFTRTTDGGSTWEAAQRLVEPPSQSYVQYSQIFVLPNGTLVDLYELYVQQPNGPITATSLQLLRSSDRGRTWSSPASVITMTPLYRPDGSTLVRDPETGQLVQDPTNPSFAIDTRNGNLYAVWEDGRFSSFQYDDIGFAMSADGGVSWSSPVRVNQTPQNIPSANRQSFLPSVAVSANGTIGVSYYDFRFNDATAGLPTDRWLVQCHPTTNSTPADPACWTGEVRLTPNSFNIEAVAPKFAGGFLFLGDYFGLATAMNDFVTTFTQPDEGNITSVFFSRR